LAQGNGVPSASGTLLKASGTGDATITFSSYTGSNWINFAGPGKVVAGNGLTYTGNTLNVKYDNVTIGVNGSNQLYVLNAGIGTTQLANSSVTYAKIQNVAADRLLGNPTGSSAAPSEISLGATLAFSGSALQTTAMTGDITTSANSFATTLATVNGSPGTFALATVTVNGKGLVTAATAATTTGTGAVVLATSPTLVTPTLGVATATSLTLSGALAVPTLTITAVYGGAATLSANTTYALRWGVNANGGETSNKLYLADWNTASYDLFWVVGLYNSASTTTTGSTITITTKGSFTLGSSDSGFAVSTDQGRPVYLGSSGAILAYSGFSPASGDANEKVAILTASSSTLYVDCEMMGVS
jgi:hypothetical protein